MGNKSDLDLKRQISQEEAQSFADAEGLPYFEVSIKEGSGEEMPLEPLEALAKKNVEISGAPQNGYLSMTWG